MILLEYLKLVIKGIFIGFGKIIPGVSGSLIAMSLGVYEEAIEKITYFFKDIPRNVIYFLFLGSGVMVSILFGSKVVLFLLANFYAPTIFLFSGLVMGSIPMIRGKVKKKDASYFFLLFSFILLLNVGMHLKGNTTFVYHNNFSSNLQVCLLGFLEAFTMIVPGISGTSLFISLGYYAFIMELFSNIFVILKNNIQIPFFFTLFFIVGVYVISMLIHYLFQYHEKLTYTMILAFSYFALFFMVKDAILKTAHLFDFFIGFLLMFFGFLLCKKIE